MTDLEDFSDDLEASVDDVEDMKDEVRDAFSAVTGEIGRIEYALDRMSGEDIHAMYQMAYSDLEESDVRRMFQRIDSQLEIAGRATYWEHLDSDQRDEIVSEITASSGYSRRKVLGGLGGLAALGVFGAILDHSGEAPGDCGYDFDLFGHLWQPDPQCGATGGPQNGGGGGKDYTSEALELETSEFKTVYDSMEETFRKDMLEGGKEGDQYQAWFGDDEYEELLGVTFFYNEDPDKNSSLMYDHELGEDRTQTREILENPQTAEKLYDQVKKDA